MAAKGLKLQDQPASWDPYQDMPEVAGLSDIFEELFANPPAPWRPKVDIQESAKAYTLSAALPPGTRPEELKAFLNKGVLTLILPKR